MGASYTKTESDNKYQPKGNYLASGYSYSKSESDGKYQPKGNYAIVDASYTKTESDNKYQLKGNYVPTSRKINGKQLNTDIKLTAEDIGALTQAQADARYLIASSNDVLGIGKYVFAKCHNRRNDFRDNYSGSELELATLYVDTDSHRVSTSELGIKNRIGVGTWKLLGPSYDRLFCSLFIRVA
ncbi:hypothetical protein EB1316870_15890 [Proteus mirabilis]